MPPRDPSKTARNKKIQTQTAELRALLPDVLADTGLPSEKELNAKIGGNATKYIDFPNAIITSPEQYVATYMKYFKEDLSEVGAKYKNMARKNFEMFSVSPATQSYFMLFLKRAYLRHMDGLIRVRPHIDESSIWIGQNNADYGLLITPRFNDRLNQWENDTSEIRHFPKLYWTIGHILHSGLVIPGTNDKIEFTDINTYLTFFRNVLVRASGSPYEKEIARLYSEYVLSSDDPEAIPLLIPEYRYDGLNKKHRYRLDFCVIDPYTMSKIGYELSPWSTHGYLSKIKGLTQKKINEMALDNFEKEMVKHRSFFDKHKIFVLIYTDTQLAKIEDVFNDLQKYLEPVDKISKLDFDLLENFFK